MALTRSYIAASADGYVADADGGVAWLERFTDPAGLGYGPFYAAVETRVMGRATYDQVRGFGDWPYDDRPTFVVTTRPLDDMPHAGVTAISGSSAVRPRQPRSWMPASSTELSLPSCRSSSVTGSGCFRPAVPHSR